MVLDEVAAYLAADSLGLTVGTNLFKGTMPEAPDAAVALIETGGPPPVVGLGETGGIQFESPTLQILVRGTADGYATARTLVEACMNSLVKAQTATLTGVIYWIFQPLQSPFFLKYDASERPYVAVNIEATKERS